MASIPTDKSPRVANRAARPQPAEVSNYEIVSGYFKIAADRLSLDPPIIVDESLSWARSRVDRRRTLRVAPLEAADRRWAVIHGWDSPRESVDPG